jgi:hypothetical protein
LESDQPSSTVPDTLREALRPEWLTGVLGRRFPGLRVVSVTPGPVTSRVSTNARFRVRCDGDPPTGLPTDLCIKGYFTDCSETAAQSRAAGLPEAMFYRELAEGLNVRTLRCLHAEVDPRTHHGVVITEDVVASGATFLDALSPYSVDETASSLEQLAVLHGRTWSSSQLALPWLEPRLESTLRARGLNEIRGNFEGSNGARVPEGVRDPERLMGVVRHLPHLVARAQPACLIHGDAHVGNLYLDASGRPCLVDWQLVQRGPWFVDVGYHLACAVAVDDRRRSERDLLGHYLGRLQAEGGQPPSWDEAWRMIAVGMVYGFFLWSITLKVHPTVIAAMLERLGAAVADHDAFRAVLDCTEDLSPMRRGPGADTDR